MHGESEAQKAKEAAEALFGKGGSKENIPTVMISRDLIGQGIRIIDLLASTGLVPSKGEGRRLIQQGGLSINDNRVDSVDLIITESDFSDNEIMVRKGKKSFHRVVLE